MDPALLGKGINYGCLITEEAGFEHGGEESPVNKIQKKKRKINSVVSGWTLSGDKNCKELRRE